MRYSIALVFCMLLPWSPAKAEQGWAPDHLQAGLGILGVVNSAQTRAIFNTLHLNGSWNLSQPWGFELGYRPAMRRSGSTKIRTLEHAHYLHSAINYRHLGDFFLWTAALGGHFRLAYSRLSTPTQERNYSQNNPGMNLNGGIGIPIQKETFMHLQLGLLLRNKNIDLYWTLGVDF
tara:strand:+ start:1696 stop:2223 length:528 start_codon:yes stop_codon:yes gene_type:complete